MSSSRANAPYEKKQNSCPSTEVRRWCPPSIWQSGPRQGAVRCECPRIRHRLVSDEGLKVAVRIEGTQDTYNQRDHGLFQLRPGSARWVHQQKRPVNPAEVNYIVPVGYSPRSAGRYRKKGFAIKELKVGQVDRRRPDHSRRRLL